MKINLKILHTKGSLTARIWLGMIFLSFLLSSCQKTKFPWEAGISAPKYYPVAGNVNFGNAGSGSNVTFSNGWGDQYGGVVSGDSYKEIPNEVYVDYFSVVDRKDYRGVIPLPADRLLELFKKYNVNNNNRAHLIVGMAPGGWVRIWFTTSNDQVEVVKGHLEAYQEAKGHKELSYENWGEYYGYWQRHGIPYEVWAENEKEYNLYFEFNKPNKREVGYSYVSADGTFYQGIGIDKRINRKLPLEMEMSWMGKSGESYCSKIIFPKNFKKNIEERKLSNINIRLEIEADEEYGILYLISDNIKEKILRFKTKMATLKERENKDCNYAYEVEYYMQ